jgi:hypothetical protein
MAIVSYIRGQVARLTVGITSATGSTVGADPAGLTFYLREPDNTSYSYVWGTNAELASTSAGGFRVLWTTAKEGIHRGGWVGTGSNAGADEFAFNVLERGWD